MKKIIAAFDGLNYSQSTEVYAIQAAQADNTFLVGVFLEDVDYHSYKIYQLITEEGGGIDTKRRHLDKKDSKKRARSVEQFERACSASNLNFKIHKDRSVAIQELLLESVYADLLVIDSNETFSHHPEKPPTHFIHQLMPHVQCPVLIVPHTYEPIDNIVLLFDGSPVSVYSIKMLCYTLPRFQHLPVEVVTVKASRHGILLPDNGLMKEYIKRHFDNVSFTVLEGFPETVIPSYLQSKKENTLVSLGAFQRSTVSRWFCGSMADTLLKNLEVPLFIAHN